VKHGQLGQNILILLNLSILIGPSLSWHVESVWYVFETPPTEAVAVWGLPWK